MRKLIWSSDGNLDYLLGLSDEEKRSYLSDIFDDELVAGLEDDQLDTYILDNTDIYNDAIDDFEGGVAPVIADQVRDGLVLDSGFNFVDPSKLIYIDGDSAELVETEDGAYFDVEGRKAFPILGFSQDDEEFIDQLEELGVLKVLKDLYPDKDELDFDDIYYYGDIIPMDWDILEKVLTKPKLSHLVIESSDTELNEASTKDSTGLKRELEEIKELSEEYGREYFTSMPFTSFDNDEMSIEYQYPNFFKIVKSFFKEMGVLQGDELEDTDVLDNQWDTDISQHDWDVIIRTCEKLVNKPGSTVQIEKEYKTGYNSPISDEEVLANREVDNFDESLNEDFVDIKYFRLSELNSMIDKVVVFNKKVIYSNLDNYDSEDEKPDFDKLGFEIEKDGDVVIPEGYTAVIKGVSSFEGYNPELYLESNGEGFEIALGWVEFGEMSIIDPSLEGSLNEALDPGHDYHCEDEDKAKLLVKMYFENEIKELSDLHDKLEPLFASKKDAVEWLYDYTRVEESLNESFFGYDVIGFDDRGDSVSLAPWDEIDQYGHPDQKLFTTADEAIEYAKNIDDKNCSVIKVEYIINSHGDREIITPSHKDAEIIWQKDSLNEDLKIITDFSEYSPWSGAVDTYNKIEEAGLLGDLESALEDIYPEGIDQTSLNDLLWFEPEYVLSLVGLESEDEDFDESLVEEDTETWPWGDPNYTGKQKIEA